jgi:hypothetical protein
LRNALLLAITLGFTVFLSAATPDAKTTRATTEEGRQVILRSDGTWAYLPQPAKESPKVVRYNKSPGAVLKINAPHGEFAMWVDPKRWKQAKTEEGKIFLEAVDGKGYGLMISEAISIPTASLKEMALHNAQKLDPSAHVVAEEKRIVNNREILCLEMEALYMNIPVTYYGYYYSGSSGNVQLVTYTSRTQFPALKSQFTDFLNGLEISDTPLPDAPQFETVSLNEGKIRIAYDTKKWGGPKRSDENKIRLTNADGSGWALIIPETVSIPLDSFPDFALENVRKVDPNTKLTLREKRTIHGQQLWCLKFSATVSSVPFIYYGYYYSGPAGTVQVLTYTTEANFKAAEQNFSELLNGLQIDAGPDVRPSSSQ